LNTLTSAVTPPPLHDAVGNVAAGALPSQHLLRRINELGVPYGREDSFKLTRQRMIQDRILIGVQAAQLPAKKFFEIAFELGMPAECVELLAPQMAEANALFFGVEDRAGGSVCKVYLEFWDKVRTEVRRTGAKTPLLLHLGVKWDNTRPGRHELARYTCHPLLSVPDVLRRMTAIYPQEGAPSARDPALEIVRKSCRQNPAATLLYIEVSESDNPRCSFDVNLYKTGLRVADAAPELRHAAAHFDIAAAVMEVQLQRLGPCPLGHLSGGIDRHGGEFLSVYGEIQPLPS